MIKGVSLAKQVVSVIVFYVIGTAVLFALASPVDLYLNTTIPAISSLTVNGAINPNAVAIPHDGAFTGGGYRTITVPYTYVGNQLVKIQITSAKGFMLDHSESTAPETWVIPYTMTFDYGDGNQTTVVNGSAINLVDFHGTYNLAKTMVFSYENIVYAAGTYSDTITFEIIAQ